jgi:hypothetical protein
MKERYAYFISFLLGMLGWRVLRIILPVSLEIRAIIVGACFSALFCLLFAGMMAVNERKAAFVALIGVLLSLLIVIFGTIILVY